MDVTEAQAGASRAARGGRQGLCNLGSYGYLRYHRMSPPLSVVADNDLKIQSPKQETVAQRVRRLQAEARTLAKDHVHSLTALLVEVEQLAAEIAEGGDAYPPGVRDLARRLVEDSEMRAQTLEAILSRN